MVDEPIVMNEQGKKVIKCRRVTRFDLTADEGLEIRLFYWAAFYGKMRYLKFMVEELRWSPFIKSFRKRSIISAAILGNQVDTVRMLLGDYTYDKV